MGYVSTNLREGKIEISIYASLNKLVGRKDINLDLFLSFKQTCGKEG